MNKILLKGLAVALWGLTSVLTLLALNEAANVVLTIYAAFWATGGQYGVAWGGAVALRQLMILFGALLALVVIVGSAEYHLRHFNTPRAWRFSSHILGVEAGILLLAAML